MNEGLYNSITTVKLHVDWSGMVIYQLEVGICCWSSAAWPPTFLYLRFSTLNSNSLRRTDTIIVAKWNKPSHSNKPPVSIKPHLKWFEINKPPPPPGGFIEDLRYVSSGLVLTYPDIIENKFFSLFSKKNATYIVYSYRFCPSTQCNYYSVPYIAWAVWCLISSYSKTSVFVHPHEIDHPAFSKISTLGPVWKNCFWCRKRRLRVDRRLKRRKAKLGFQKANMLQLIFFY